MMINKTIMMNIKGYAYGLLLMMMLWMSMSIAVSAQAETDIPDAILDALASDFSEQVGVPIEDVAVVSVEPITWPDGGMGCPLPPDVGVITVLIDGYVVTLQAGESSIAYHVDESGYIGCSFDLESPEIPTDIFDMLASDFSERAGVLVEDISLASAEAATWSNGGMGCPGQIDVTFGFVDGYIVTLQASESSIVYHVSDTGNVGCSIFENEVTLSFLGDQGNLVPTAVSFSGQRTIGMSAIGSLMVAALLISMQVIVVYRQS